MEMGIGKATLYNFISKYVSMIVQFAITMILARLVIPEDHGVIAILLVLLNFLSLIADMGIGISIIQRPEMSKVEQNRLFTFTFILSVVAVIVMLVASFPISIIYSNSEYKILCPLISISGFFNILNIVPNAALIRDKKFDVMAIRSVLVTAISGLVAVILAFCKAGVYALVIQSVFSSIFLFVWNYTRNTFKIEKFNKKELFHLMGKYSLFQFIFNILNYFSRNLDSLVIGAKLGDAQLGYYNKAYSLNLYPNILFTSVFTGVLHPYIRDYKDDFELLEKKLVSILKVLSLAGIIMMAICYTCAREIILIVFGNQWELAVPCFKMLSICIWAQMLSSVAGSVFLGIERTDQTLKCGIINLILIVFSIIIALPQRSIKLVSLCIGIAYNVIFFVTYFILIKRTMKLKFFKFLRHFVLDVIFAIGMMVLVSYVFDSLVEIIEMGVWLSIIIKTFISIFFWIAYIFLSKQYVNIKEIFNHIRKGNK